MSDRIMQLRLGGAFALVAFIACGGDERGASDTTGQDGAADTAPDSAVDTADGAELDTADGAALDTADSAALDTADGADTSADADDVGDVATVPWGLDERPSGTSCRAFARPELPRGGEVAFEKAFPNMDFAGQAIGLVRTRIGPDGQMRWFVLDRLGKIWTFVDPLAAEPELYLELPETPYGSQGEGGLLGFAFDPDFALRADANYVYVHYTTWPDNNVWRFRVGASGDASEPWRILESKRILVTESGGGNHWGGDLKFGPDRYLYVSLGDGGNGMTASDAVKTTWLRGKILRIDPIGPIGPGGPGGPDALPADVPYLIPPDNPWARPGAALCDARDLRDNREDCPEIFARGFRNPWRMTFDRETGRLWVGDVGSGKEEVDLVLPGHDYGWNRCDGRNPVGSCPPAAADSPLIAPIAQYRVYNSASIAGGFVYRGSALGAALRGAYLFTDVYNGELLVIDEPYRHVTFEPTLRVADVYEHPDERDEDDLPKFRKLDAPTLAWPVSWAEDEHAELYLVTFGFGAGEGVWKLVPPGGAAVDSVPATLSATGCSDPADVTRPAPGMLAYELNAPFWSDGADKQRYLALPEGARIGVGDDGDWDLPIGSVVMKTFRRGGRPIETRLMLRHDDGGWAGYSYVWRADGSDADKAIATGETRVWGDEAWSYPSRSGCMSCHTAEAGFTLGLETRQLNRDHLYAESGRLANQLDTWDHIGLFARPLSADEAAFVSPFGNAPLDERARTYLHANCAQCHRGERLPDLRFDASLADSGLCDGDRLTKLVALMRTSDPTQRMPRGAGLVIDAAGVALVEAWVESPEGLASCP